MIEKGYLHTSRRYDLAKSLELRISQLAFITFICIPVLLYVNIGQIPIFTGYILISFLFPSTLLFLSLNNNGNQKAKITPLIPILLVFTLPGLLLNKPISMSFTLARYLHLANFFMFFTVVRYYMKNWNINNVITKMMAVSLVSPLISFIQSVSFNHLGTYLVINWFRDNAKLLYGANAAEYFKDGGYYSWLGSTSFLKAPGIYTTPAENAFYSLMILCIATATLLERKGEQKLNPDFLLLVAITHTGNIIISATRSVWLATILSLLFIIILRKRLFLDKNTLLLSLSSMFALLIGIAIIGIDNIYIFVQKLLSGQDSSTIGRFSSLIDGINLFFNHPFFGVGLGNADFMIGGNIHSMAVTMLAELGIFGAIYLTAFFAIMFLSGLNLISNKNDRQYSAIGLAFCGIVLGMFLNSLLFANNFFHPKVALPLWGLHALVIGLSNDKR